MKRIQLILALISVLVVPQFNQISHAHPGVRFGIGINLWPGGYWGPYYPYGYPYYYGPGPYVYPPATVVVPAAPAVIVQPTPAPTLPTPVPIPAPANNYVPPPPPPPPAASTSTPVIPAASESPRVDALLAQLNDGKDTVRRDAAMDLGRMKSQRAIDPLLTMLSKDQSAIARDAAARALGLIGSSRTLNALICAAQADNDRDVRHSAQFAVEVIRTNLRGGN
jgi:hypothetical protein